jgi:hypothetical protein
LDVSVPGRAEHVPPWPSSKTVPRNPLRWGHGQAVSVPRARGSQCAQSFCALSDFSASENWLGWVTYVLVAADTNSAGWSDGQAVFGESGPARRGRPDKTAVASCAASPLFSAGQELPFGPPKPTANQRTSAEDSKGSRLTPSLLAGNSPLVARRCDPARRARALASPWAGSVVAS